jgi:hypothetical protein
MRNVTVIATLAVIAVLSLSSLHTSIAQSVAPFSGQLPSEHYFRTIVYPHSESSASGLSGGDRDLLFGPPPPPPDTGSGTGGAVGEAPVTDALWLLIFCSLLYGLCCRQNFDFKTLGMYMIKKRIRKIK